MRAISRGLAVAELKSAQAILGQWAKRLEQGVPGEDYHPEGADASDPEEPLNPDEFYEKLQGELLIVSGKCEALATVLQAAS